MCCVSLQIALFCFSFLALILSTPILPRTSSTQNTTDFTQSSLRSATINKRPPTRRTLLDIAEHCETLLDIVGHCWTLLDLRTHWPASNDNRHACSVGIEHLSTNCIRSGRYLACSVVYSGLCAGSWRESCFENKQSREFGSEYI